MDKYEYTIKSEKIKKLVERKDYETAAKIADSIDWDRVKNVKLLSTVSLAYEKAERYEDARDILLMAYECAPVGRRFLSKLTELAVKQGNFDEAEDYLKEFSAASPQDPSRLILRYEIAKAKGEPAERLIMILEAYQKREFEEKWSYELAQLYYNAGKTEECVKLCDEIVLWFGVGSYVDKAMELKQRIMPLSPEQVEKQENKEKYLRRLKDVQREFEDGKEPEKAERTAPAKSAGAEVKGNVPETKSTKTVAELAAEALREQAAAESFGQGQKADVEKIRSLEEIRARQAEAARQEETRQEEAARQEAARREEEARQKEEARLREEEEVRRTEAARRQAEEEARLREEALTREIEQKAAAETARLQAEMESRLAREIETEAMAATINEAMLRETAATMEEVGAVENDHSDSSERTKIAAGPFGGRTKTREFVIQARAINQALAAAGGRSVTAEEVEARIAAENAARRAEAQAAAEAARQAEAAEAKKAARAAEAERRAKAEAQAAKAAEEEEAARAAEAERRAKAEAAAKAAEEEEAARAAEAEEASRAADITDRPAEIETNPVQDHYVLIASDNEESGLHECVAYIRRMRELLGRPATQIAKISGSRLATKNIEKTLTKLQGRDLIVVGIAALPTEMLSQTIDFMARDEVECFIALIDTEEEIERLQRRMVFFADCRVLSCDGTRPQVEPEPPQLQSEPEVRQEWQQQPEPEVKQEWQQPGPEREQVPQSEPETAPDPQKSHRTLAELVEEALNTGGLAAMTPDAGTEKEPSTPEQAVIAKTDDMQAMPSAGDDVEAASYADDTREEPAGTEAKEEVSAEEERRSRDTAASEGEMSPNDFFDFAVEYARMLDAVVDDLGGLALFAEIEECQQERVPLTEELAQELIEKAILKAERRSIRSLFSNRYDKEGYLILKEEHFKE